MKRSLIIALLSIMAFPGGIRALDYSRIANIRFDVTHDTNVSKASSPSDQADDTIAALSGSYGRRLQLNEADRVSVTVDFARIEYTEYNGMDNTRAGVSAAWFRKPGLGPRAPWLNVQASAARLGYRYDIWDGAEYTAAISAGKSFNDFFSLSAAHVVRDRTASTNDVYSGNSYTSSIVAGFSFRNGLRLSAGYGLSRGDITAHCIMPRRPSDPTLYEELFDSWAYRRVFKTQIYSLAASYPLGYTTTVFAGMERMEARRAARNYPLELFRMGIAHSME